MSITIIKKTIMLSFLCVSLIGTMPHCLADDVTLQQLAAAETRSDANRNRNQYRHPTETLTFFGIRPDMSVLEIWPGHGWYTEILAPYLKKDGKLTLAHFPHNDGTLKDERSMFWAKVSQRLQQRIADNAEIFGSPDSIELAAPVFVPAQNEQFDMVVTFRNAHIWDEDGYLFATLQSIFQSLKPGGVLGMVEHRAARLSDISSAAVEGYLDEAYVIHVAENAGFTLVASSEINANPADRKNYPKGVYALPPTLAMGHLNQQEYQAIGESDRMTLKFVKPVE